jgi:ubiquinone/menaquinone biosynthesis C-methylase UbiE
MPFGYIKRGGVRDLLLRLIGWPNIIRRIQFPVIIKLASIKQNDIILDIGCGDGTFCLEFIRASGCKCIGLDLIENEKWTYIIKETNNKASFIVGDAHNLPFKNNSIDIIILSSVIQMVQNALIVLKECKRVLKNEGRIIISVPVEYLWFRKLNCVKKELSIKYGSKGKGYYSKQEIFELLSYAGFRIIKIIYSPNTFEAFFIELLILFCYYLNLPISSSIYNILLLPLLSISKLYNHNLKHGIEMILLASKKAE